MEDEGRLADDNQRLATAHGQQGSAFVPFIGDTTDILWVKEPRVVGADNTARCRGKSL